jgi:hypothetical protein
MIQDLKSHSCKLAPILWLELAAPNVPRTHTLVGSSKTRLAERALMLFMVRPSTTDGNG